MAGESSNIFRPANSGVRWRRTPRRAPSEDRINDSVGRRPLREIARHLSRVFFGPPARSACDRDLSDRAANFQRLLQAKCSRHVVERGASGKGMISTGSTDETSTSRRQRRVRPFPLRYLDRRRCFRRVAAIASGGLDRARLQAALPKGGLAESGSGTLRTRHENLFHAVDNGRLWTNQILPAASTAITMPAIT